MLAAQLGVVTCINRQRAVKQAPRILHKAFFRGIYRCVEAAGVDKIPAVFFIHAGNMVHFIVNSEWLIIESCSKPTHDQGNHVITRVAYRKPSTAFQMRKPYELAHAFAFNVHGFHQAHELADNGVCQLVEQIPVLFHELLHEVKDGGSRMGVAGDRRFLYSLKRCFASSACNTACNPLRMGDVGLNLSLFLSQAQLQLIAWRNI